MKSHLGGGGFINFIWILGNNHQEGEAFRLQVH